jgi:hypothetical protein
MKNVEKIVSRHYIQGVFEVIVFVVLKSFSQNHLSKIRYGNEHKINIFLNFETQIQGVPKMAY